MPTVERVLDPEPCPSLEAYLRQGGGEGLRAARAVHAEAVISAVSDSGLRGRGGAGFPTGRKWETVRSYGSETMSARCVVNAAEGEPGSFKDRFLLRQNPYRVLEGALIGAHAVDSAEVVVAMKASFGPEFERVNQAIDEMDEAGWFEETTIGIALGPNHYLTGEETALIEVIDGRPPFPRVTPPYRRGAAGDDEGAASVELATHDRGSGPGPDLVNNVETFANVPRIIAEGPSWFRSIGAEDTPGTLVCTVTGHTRRHGMGEFPSGTPLAEVAETIGGGFNVDRNPIAALSGVSNPIIPASEFDTPLTHEAMIAAGTGLGATGFIFFDDRTTLTDIATGVSRFLAVESCGQCEPCKRDGRAIHETLIHLADHPESEARAALADRASTITDGARCYLAQQHQNVVSGLLRLVPDLTEGLSHAVEPVLIAPITDVRNGRAVLDDRQLTKQPDWSHEATDTGKVPRWAAGTEEAPKPSGGGAPVGSPLLEEPLRPIRDAHSELRRLLDRATEVTGADRTDVIDDLERVLRRHQNVTERVLYPMVRRRAGTAGEDAAVVAERTESLARDVAERSDTLGDEQLEQLRRRIEQHISADNEIVIPLLEATLDQTGLSALGESLREAELKTPAP